MMKPKAESIAQLNDLAGSALVRAMLYVEEHLLAKRITLEILDHLVKHLRGDLELATTIVVERAGTGQRDPALALISVKEHSRTRQYSMPVLEF